MYRRPRTQLLLAFMLLLPSLSCEPSVLLGPDAPQGIEGMVTIGPQCPTQSPENPCPDRPYEASIEVRLQKGGSVGLVRSGSDGRFRVGLRPGSYTLRPRSGDPFPIAPEQDVEVEAGRFSEVTILFDTGIR